MGVIPNHFVQVNMFEDVVIMVNNTYGVLEAKANSICYNPIIVSTHMSCMSYFAREWHIYLKRKLSFDMFKIAFIFLMFYIYVKKPFIQKC